MASLARVFMCLAVLTMKRVAEILTYRTVTPMGLYPSTFVWTYFRIVVHIQQGSRMRS